MRCAAAAGAAVITTYSLKGGRFVTVTRDERGNTIVQSDAVDVTALVAAVYATLYETHALPPWNKLPAEERDALVQAAVRTVVP